MAGGLAGAFTSAFTSMIQGGREASEVLFGAFMSILSMFANMGLTSVFGGLFRFNDGGEWIPHARAGLEIVGGQWGRDTVPAVVSRGEVVMPSPTVERLNAALDQGSMGGGATVYYSPFLTTGSRHAELLAGRRISEVIDGSRGYEVIGSL